MFSLDLGYAEHHSDAQHVENFENPGGGIGGVSYVFAEMDRRTIDATLRADILFTRNVSLQLYAQPYMTVGEFSNARQLARPASYEFDEADDVPEFDPATVSDYDFKYSAVNVNAVLRWEYAPGSTFYLVWKQGRDLYEDRGSVGGFDPALDPGGMFDSEPENVVLAKLTYWFSI
ncbi:MAG: DUF5916 domain-containing protein [Candidatus Eisenbacteria bacterium]